MLAVFQVHFEQSDQIMMQRGVAGVVFFFFLKEFMKCNARFKSFLQFHFSLYPLI